MRCSSRCFDEDTAGVRPEVLATVQRHVLEHITDLARVAPMVQILDAPVPQTVEQLPNIVQFFAAQLPVVAEPVIEVPKIFPLDVPLRSLGRDTQLAEVPTIVSYSWLQLRMEQNVDIPVPGRGGRISGLQGFPPGQSSTVLHSSVERISERIVEQIVDIPGGGLQDFRPGQSSSSSLHVPAGLSEVLDEPKRKVRPPHPPSVSPSTPAPQHRVRSCSGSSGTRTRRRRDD